MALWKQEGISEHKQVRKALKKFGKKNIQTELNDLATLRKKADYEPFRDISPKEVDEAIEHMENIFQQLKFQWKNYFFLNIFKITKEL